MKTKCFAVVDKRTFKIPIDGNLWLYVFFDEHSAWKGAKSENEANNTNAFVAMPAEVNINIINGDSASKLADESILVEADKIVSGPREEQYGDAEENFAIAAEIFNSINHKKPYEINSSGVVLVLMAVKLAREGNKHSRDNLVDLAGYAEILNRLEKAKEKK
jgi:hypothetical protein